MTLDEAFAIVGRVTVFTVGFIGLLSIVAAVAGYVAGGRRPR